MTNVFLFCPLASAEIKTSFWNIKKSDHFIVYFQNAQPKYIDEIIRQAEEYYNDITGQLGFTRFDNFWTWENRAKIYIFNSKREYTKMTGKPQWSAAHTDVITREIYCYLDMENFFDIILPHELGHIIFREFIGYKRKLPLWVDEGVVSYLEKKYKAERLFFTKNFVRAKGFMTLEDMHRTERGFQVMPDIFYAEAASVIEFLIRVYGKDKFVEFCQRLRDLRFDQDWFVALNDVYRFRDLAEMNAAWVKFLEN